MDDNARTPIGRRQMLQLTGVAIAGLAGCQDDQNASPETRETELGTRSAERPKTTTSSTPTDSPTPTATPTPIVDADYADRFETIVDMTDAGADPTGSAPIDDVVREHAGEDTLLVFRDGRYRLDRLLMPIPDNLGLVAARDATPAIVPTGDHPTEEWLLFSDVTDFLYDGIDFDLRETGPIGGTVLSGPGDIEVRNLRVRGGYDTEDQQLMRIDVTDEEGVAVVENFVAAGVDEPHGNTTGLYVGRTHAGEITIRDCHLERFSDNALYASPPGGDGGRYDAANGTVHVRGGTYRNNNIAGIRIGSTGSTVKDATVVVNEVPWDMDDDSVNARGIRLRGKRDQVVENCRLVYGPDAPESSGAITFNGANGRATVRNVEIEMNRDDVRAIHAKRPEIDGEVAPTFENVTVRGTAGGEQTVTITDRPGTTFDGCCIHQQGDERDGIQFVDSADCVIENSDIDVSGSPVVLQNSSLASAYRPSPRCDGMTPG